MLRRARESFEKLRRLLEAFNRRTARTEIERWHDRLRTSDPDNLTLCGYSVYSQGDEDGILHEILRRLGVARGTFLEIGVGDGRENNTAYLLASGWTGAWVDANSRQIVQIRGGFAPLIAAGQLTVFEMLVGPHNVGTLKNEFYASHPIDVFSLDIDGQDLHVAAEIFKDPGFRPKVVVVEYNAVFPPPLEFAMPLGAAAWRAGDYFGVSYSAWLRFFAERGFKPVGCSLTGSNIFLVREDLARRVLPDPPAADAFYRPARYDLIAGFRSGHPRSYEALVTVATMSASAAAN
jgi:hypothetical protein